MVSMVRPLDELASVAEGLLMTKTYPWDAAEALDTPAAQAEYLSLVFADGDAADVARALGIVARAHGMSADGGAFNLSTLLSVMRGLGMKITITPLSEDA